jgi:tetratricopeptide (TPR) repeat protein
MTSLATRISLLPFAAGAKFLPLLFVAAAIFFTAIGSAQAETSQEKMQDCLKRAVDMPDLALAEANAWLKQGGGSPALLCRATAQFHTGDFAQSANDFAQLAAAERNPHQASFLYQQAGLAATRVNDFRRAEQDYSQALKLEQQDPEIWANRAAMRAAAQNYWEAIDDLNHALTIMPDMLEALRLRGQVWYKLGNEAKAEDDFRRVAEMQAEDDVLKTGTPPVRPVAAK